MNKESLFWENGGLKQGEKWHGKTWEEEMDKRFGGGQWWEDMKERIRTKDKEQTDLDRKLVETVGNRWTNEGNFQMNLEEVENLIGKGAKPDFWVSMEQFEEEDDGRRRNVMDMALANDSEDGKRATRILVEAFPEFRKDQTKRGPSLLGWLRYNWLQNFRKKL